MLNSNFKLMPKVRVRNTSYMMKYVPGTSEEGYLDPKAQKEVDSSITQTDTGGLPLV